MGHRTNYVIRESGAIHLFYSHWGALSVPDDIFWGPRYAEEFIRQTEATEEWLDDVWAEGAVALDKDARTVAFYGLSELGHPPLAEVTLELMGAVWAGWQVRQVGGLPEIAALVGVDPDSVLAPPAPLAPIARDDLGTNIAEGFYCGLLSIRVDGRWLDFALEHEACSVLAAGPEVLTWTSRMTTLAELRDLHAARPLKPYEDSRPALGHVLGDFALVDPAEQRLALTLSDPRRAAFLGKVWPGWSCEPLTGGVRELFRRTGRDVPADLEPAPPRPSSPPGLTLEDTVARVAEHLFSSDDRKSENAAWIRRALSNMATGDGPRWVAPGVLTPVPASKPEHDTARAIFEDAVRAIRRQ
jgi:hypothetical protein